MGYLEVEGGRPLRGRLTVQGAKNSVLPILAATLLAPGTSVIHNCPRLADVSAMLAILRHLGCQVRQEGDTAVIDAAALDRWDVPEQMMRALRSSVIFLGALLARLGRAELSYPGGCELGPRPIDLHLSGLRTLGAELEEAGGMLVCQGGAALSGREICLSLPSVGATENLMLAACGCPGVTTIVGAAREPEIVDLQNFLRSMGGQVSGAGSSTLVISGGRALHGTEYTVMGDRMAAATYLCSAGAAGGEIEVNGTDPDHLTAVLNCLEQAGCAIGTGPDRILLKSAGRLRGVSPIRTNPYPGFPTDAQAVVMAALAGGTGTTMLVENMFDSRYRHVDELRRMGAHIQTYGRVAVVIGAGRLSGAEVHSTDLRGGAALAVAALGADGVTKIHDLHHIARGYEDMAGTLTALGGAVRQVSGPLDRRRAWQQNEPERDASGTGEGCP